MPALRPQPGECVGSHVAPPPILPTIYSSFFYKVGIFGCHAADQHHPHSRRRCQRRTRSRCGHGALGLDEPPGCWVHQRHIIGLEYVGDAESLTLPGSQEPRWSVTLGSPPDARQVLPHVLSKGHRDGSRGEPPWRAAGLQVYIARIPARPLFLLPH